MTRRAKHFVLILAASALLPACATVDLAEVASAPTARAEAPAEVNVVRRAVEKLKLAFTQRGFGPRASERKMNAAADMLLNGLNRTTNDPADSYNAATKAREVVIADIQLATRHIDQTTRAAEIHLEMAPANRKMVDELQNLEAALVVSEKAARIFAAALNDEDAPELIVMRESVDGLRRVTDDFGIRVRMERSDKIAVAAASSGFAN